MKLKGTVVDMHCYVTHGIRDAEHTGCSNACIARGVPAGFLAEDGKLYVLFGEKPFSVKETVQGHRRRAGEGHGNARRARRGQGDPAQDDPEDRRSRDEMTK